MVFIALLFFLRAIPADTSDATAPIQPLRLAGIENAFRLTDRVLSGGQPETDADFAALQAAGVKTILSVDGGRPDLERAARFGLRYVHVLHGYDGIGTNTALRLIKAAQTVPGPVFVHCHHGKHRGPAAAGLICQATAGWTTNQAVAWLQQAGTSPEYPGLYCVNLEFRLPDPAALAAVSTDFPARAEVSDLASAMVEIDRHWDHLRAVQRAGWRVPAAHPDLVPAREALLLAEAYNEIGRTAVAAAPGADFQHRLGEAGTQASELATLLRTASLPPTAQPLQSAEDLMTALQQDCNACHRQHRN